MKERKPVILGARVLSSVFRPNYYLTAGMVFLLTCTYLSLLPWMYKLWLLSMVVVFTIALPALGTYLFRRSMGWHVQQLREQHKRYFPYILHIVGALICLNLIARLHLPSFVRAMFAASIAMQVLCTLINVWWKISVHSAGAGAIIGGLVAYSFIFQFNPVWWLCLAVLISGLVNSSRMLLRQHTLWQVLGGTWVGFACGLLAILFI